MKIRQTRRILGEEIKHLTNKQVDELILHSSALVEVILDMFDKDKNERKKQILDRN